MTVTRESQGRMARAIVLRFVSEMEARGVPHTDALEAIVVHSIMELARAAGITPSGAIGNLREVLEDIERGPEGPPQ